MGTILYIGNCRDITDNIDNLQVINHKVAVLNLKYNYKHYIEEYMPDYILLSENIDGFEEITDYVSNQTTSNLIITGSNRKNKNMIPGSARIECPETWERFKKIIETIDIVDPGQKRCERDYRFLRQEVISFYSIQGGTGKTSLVFNTAWRLKEKDMGKILVIDLNCCEGPSDLTLNLNADKWWNIGDFIDETLEGKGNICKNVPDIEGIDILCPPLSLYQSERLSVDMLDSIIYSSRNEYDLIIADLPFRYDNISLEMLNISTASVLVLSPDMTFIPRIKAFKKFLPVNQKR